MGFDVLAVGLLALIFTIIVIIQVIATSVKPKPQEKSLREMYAKIGEAPTDNSDILLTEYEQTQLMLQHYDNLNWQIGSILIGSNIVALGFLAQTANPQASVLTGAAMAGTFSVFVWILWFFRHRAIYNVKNDRLFWIEEELGMYQHRMVGFAGETEQQWLGPVGGHHAAILLWAGLTLAWVIVLI